MATSEPSDRAEGSDVPGRDPDTAADRLEWLAATLMCSGAYIRALAEATERGDADLPVAPSAWDNALAALEWQVMEHVRGRVQWTREVITLEDAARVSRLRALGAEALEGGPRSPDLAPLAEACLSMMYGSDWRDLMPDVAADAQAIVHGYPPS
jgi:hypothetical protein